MPHSLRYVPLALACSLTLNAHLISESQSAPRHQVPLSPSATQQPAPTHCEPMPFCLLSEPQSQPVSTTSRIIKSPRKPAPGFLLKSKLKHLKTKRRTIRHDPLNANITPSHSVIPQLSINPAKRSSKGAYAGAATSTQSFPHPKKDRAEATTDGVIRTPPPLHFNRSRMGTHRIQLSMEHSRHRDRTAHQLCRPRVALWHPHAIE